MWSENPTYRAGKRLYADSETAGKKARKEGDFFGRSKMSQDCICNLRLCSKATNTWKDEPMVCEFYFNKAFFFFCVADQWAILVKTANGFSFYSD